MSKKLIESKISIAKNKSAEIQALKSAGIISGSQFDEAVASFMTAIFELTIGFEIKSENPAEKISKRFKLGKKFKSADIPTLKLIASMLKDIKTDTVIGSNDITSDEDDEDDMDIKLPDDTSKLVPVTSADVETLSKKERMFMVMSIILECRDISIEDIMTLSASAEVYRKYLTTRNTIVIASASTLAVAGAITAGCIYASSKNNAEGAIEESSDSEDYGSTEDVDDDIIVNYDESDDSINSLL